MRNRAKVKEDFTPAAKPEGEIVTFPRSAKQEEAKTRLTGNALRLDQFRRQKEMLAAIMAAQPAVEAQDLRKQQQAARHTPDVEKAVAGQAVIQENGGSIFSKGYDRFFGIV